MSTNNETMQHSEQSSQNALLISGIAGLAVIFGDQVFTIGHLILGIVLLGASATLSRAPFTHRAARGLCVLLILGTLADAVLVKSGVYDGEPSMNPLRLRNLMLFAIWGVATILQAKHEAEATE